MGNHCASVARVGRRWRQASLVLALAAGAARGQTIVDFNADIAALSGTPANVSASSFHIGIAPPVTLLRNFGATANSATGRFNSSGLAALSLATAISSSDAVSVTITPATGYAIDFSTVNFTLQSSTQGAANANLLALPPGFNTANSLQQYAINRNNSPSPAMSHAFAPGGTFSGRTASTTFSLYFWGAGNTSGTTSVNALTFEGLVSARWDGGGANDNLGTAGNWVGAAPGPTVGLQFEGINRTTPVVNANRTTPGVRFAPGALPFEIAGSSVLTIGPAGIANYSSHAQTILAPIVVADWQIWRAHAGNLVIGGDVALGEGSSNNTLTIDGPMNTTISGSISNGGPGASGVIKNGAGVLTLSGTSSYSTTHVQAGTLHLPNGAQVTSSFSIDPGAALTGTGIAAGAVAVKGTIAPGPGIGTLHTGDLTIDPTGTYLAEIDWNNTTAQPPDSDQIDVSGSVSLSAGATLGFIFHNAPAGAVVPTRTVVLVRNDGADPIGGVGSFTTITPASGEFAGLLIYTIHYNYDADSETFGTGNDIAVSFASVPEPAGGLVMLAALMGISIRRRQASTSAARSFIPCERSTQ